MKVVDRRSTKAKRLLLDVVGSNDSRQVLMLSAAPPYYFGISRYVEYDRRHNSIVSYSEAKVNRIYLPKNHFPLMIFRAPDTYIVAHTDDKKFYLTAFTKARDKEGKPTNETASRTFDFGSPDELQVFDGALVFKTRTGKWQVLDRQSFNFYDAVTMNQTVFRDRVRDRSIQLDPNKFGALLGVAPSSVSTGYTAVFTQDEVHIYNNHKLIARAYLDPGLRKGLEHNLRQGEPFTSNFLSREIVVKTAGLLYKLDLNLSSNTPEVKEQQVLDHDVDQLYRDTNNVVIYRKGLELYIQGDYYATRLGGAQIKPDLYKLELKNTDLVHAQRVGFFSYLLQYGDGSIQLKGTGTAFQTLVQKLLAEITDHPQLFTPQTIRDLLKIPNLIEALKLCQ